MEKTGGRGNVGMVVVVSFVDRTTGVLYNVTIGVTTINGIALLSTANTRV